MTEEERKVKIARQQHKWYLKNRVKVIAQSISWRETNRDQVNKCRRKRSRKEINKRERRAYNIANRDRTNKQRAPTRKKRRDSMVDSYVREKLCNRSSLTAKDIPQGLINAKRSHIKLLRQLKEQGNG